MIIYHKYNIKAKAKGRYCNNQCKEENRKKYPSQTKNEKKKEIRHKQNKVNIRIPKFSTQQYQKFE
jgi:hypothetical protein